MRLQWILTPLGCVCLLAGCQSIAPVRSSGPEPASAGSVVTPPAPSPWQAARERGMAFRAEGQDPAWSVEVEKSRHPALVIVQGQDQAPYKVPSTTPFSDPQTGTVGFRGVAADGTAVTLTIERGQCQDNMSRKTRADAVELSMGTQQLVGCGRFLF